MQKTRVRKRITYAANFLALLALVVVLFGYTRLKTEVTNTFCSDHSLNQGEEDIDCGGPCVACPAPTVDLVVGGVRIIGAGDNTIFVIDLNNPSVDYGSAKVPYVLEVKDDQGNTIKRIEDSTPIAPDEYKRVVIPVLGVGLQGLGEPTFLFGKADFATESELPAYSIGLTSLTTTFPPDKVQVAGTVTNETSGKIKRLRLTAVMFTAGGDIANASVTILDNLSPFSPQKFTIVMPRSEYYIDPSLTKVSWEVLD